MQVQYNLWIVMEDISANKKSQLWSCPATAPGVWSSH